MTRTAMATVLLLVVATLGLLAAADQSSGSYSLHLGRTMHAGNGEGQLIFRIDRRTGRTWATLVFMGADPGQATGGLSAGRWQPVPEPTK
jgi:hypothetical protein